jgi:PTS system beta-glucosides-specific IIC component
VDFLGIPVTLINYQSSVIPIVVAVFLQSRIEKLVQPRIHQAVRGIIAPVISLVIVGLLTFMVIGPVSNLLAVTLSNAISSLLSIAPPVAGAVLGTLYPLMLIFGFHWGIIPLAMNNFATMGGDPLFAITMGTNFAVAGCTLGVLLKTKKADVRELSISAFVSALLGGVTEPAIYGVLLKYKKPFAVVCIMSGIGGIILAMSGALLTAMLTGSLMTLPALIAMMGAPVAIAAAIGLVGGAVCTYLFGYSDDMNK